MLDIEEEHSDGSDEGKSVRDTRWTVKHAGHALVTVWAPSSERPLRPLSLDSVESSPRPQRRPERSQLCGTQSAHIHGPGHDTTAHLKNGRSVWRAAAEMLSHDDSHLIDRRRRGVVVEPLSPGENDERASSADTSNGSVVATSLVPSMYD